MKSIALKTPQLYLGKNKHGQDCWSLTHYDGPVTVCLEIRYYHGDEDGNPNHYTVMAANDSDTGACGYREVMTTDEMRARYEIIAENEGYRAADAWNERLEDDYILVNPAIGNTRILEIAQQLQRRWEAMINLNLFAPSINN